MITTGSTTAAVRLIAALSTWPVPPHRYRPRTKPPLTPAERYRTPARPAKRGWQGIRIRPCRRSSASPLVSSSTRRFSRGDHSAVDGPPPPEIRARPQRRQEPAPRVPTRLLEPSRVSARLPEPSRALASLREPHSAERRPLGIEPWVRRGVGLFGLGIVGCHCAGRKVRSSRSPLRWAFAAVLPPARSAPSVLTPRRLRTPEQTKRVVGKETGPTAPAVCDPPHIVTY